MPIEKDDKHHESSLPRDVRREAGIYGAIRRDAALSRQRQVRDLLEASFDTIDAVIE
ncbi:MAG: hypothetical protein ACLTDC_05650 [Lachnospiraceae bacterium]